MYVCTYVLSINTLMCVRDYNKIKYVRTHMNSTEPLFLRLGST